MELALQIALLLAAAIYVLKNIINFRGAYIKWRLDRIIRRHDLAMNRIKADVQPAVELWWMNKGYKPVREHLLNIYQDEDDPFLNLRLMSLRDSAISLAVHLRGQSVSDELIRALKRYRTVVGEDNIDAESEWHKDHLNQHRLELVEAGVDMQDFESEFAPVNTN